MSKDAVLKFYDAIENTDALKQQCKAITRPEEIVKLGAKHGYFFTGEEMTAADADYTQKREKPLITIDSSDSDKSFPQAYHYEFKCSEIPGFEEISQEVEKLEIKPDTVDIELFEKSFREFDLQFANVSPVSPEFKARYLKSLETYLDLGVEPRPEYAWSQFHLINLDRYVDHALYEDYFNSKVKLIKQLEYFFETDLRFSGSLWYPPNAYRMWHTNETQPGWRMYFVDYDNYEELTGEDRAFFRYMNPETKELVTIAEKTKVVRFFKIESAPDKLLWHCIVNRTKANRWSFGFNLSHKWMNKLLIF
ncbi:MAG: Nif11 family protein [Hormoscilla sp. GM7CHS1pb]|nr:Nif11 family protein [Hormoscilla sp. GM7CHS1pb]